VTRFAIALAACASWSCTAATWDAIGAAAAGAAAGMSASPYGAAPSSKLMLFGGPGHDTYLGCLNCSEFASDSVLNEFGRHGSAFQANSIFNRIGQFGSAISTYSACNPIASDPPVIVDGQGRFYGRLTVNAYHHQRTANPTFQALVAVACVD
jgi:hypothetical protein